LGQAYVNLVVELPTPLRFDVSYTPSILAAATAAAYSINSNNIPSLAFSEMHQLSVELKEEIVLRGTGSKLARAALQVFAKIIDATTFSSSVWPRLWSQPARIRQHYRIATPEHSLRKDAPVRAMGYCQSVFPKRVKRSKSLWT
jgi:hypothetical protein